MYTTYIATIWWLRIDNFFTIKNPLFFIIYFIHPWIFQSSSASPFTENEISMTLHHNKHWLLLIHPFELEVWFKYVIKILDCKLLPTTSLRALYTTPNNDTFSSTCDSVGEMKLEETIIVAALIDFPLFGCFNLLIYF